MLANAEIVSIDDALDSEKLFARERFARFYVAVLEVVGVFFNFKAESFFVHTFFHFELDLGVGVEGVIDTALVLLSKGLHIKLGRFLEPALKFLVLFLRVLATREDLEIRNSSSLGLRWFIKRNRHLVVYSLELVQPPNHTLEVAIHKRLKRVLALVFELDQRPTVRAVALEARKPPAAEFLEVDHTIFVNVKIFQGFLRLFFIEWLPKLSAKHSQLLLIDGPTFVLIVFVELGLHHILKQLKILFLPHFIS